MKNQTHYSLSVIVPCYNEESNIIQTLKEISLSIEIPIIKEYEILVIDDASTDKSNSLVKNYKKNNLNIKLHKNEINIGLGGAIKRGFKLCSKDYVIYIPGDNCHKSIEIKKMIELIGKYDVILTYYSNPHVRTFFRKFFTKLYTPFLNFIFNLDLPYYNGLCLYKSSLIKNINIETNSFTWQIELLLKLFKSTNIKYTLVPTKLDDRNLGQSKAFNLKNSLLVVYSIFKLFVLQFFISKKK